MVGNIVPFALLAAGAVQGVVMRRHDESGTLSGELVATVTTTATTMTTQLTTVSLPNAARRARSAFDNADRPYGCRPRQIHADHRDEFAFVHRSIRVSV